MKPRQETTALFHLSFFSRWQRDGSARRCHDVPLARRPARGAGEEAAGKKIKFLRRTLGLVGPTLLWHAVDPLNATGRVVVLILQSGGRQWRAAGGRTRVLLVLVQRLGRVVVLIVSCEGIERLPRRRTLFNSVRLRGGRTCGEEVSFFDSSAVLVLHARTTDIFA